MNIVIVITIYRAKGRIRYIEFFKNKTEAELKKFIFSGFGTVEKNAFEKNSSIVKIPIFDVMYKASGTTGNRGGGSSSTATTGYYLTDPLQV